MEEDIEIVGQVVGGGFGDIMVRQKSKKVLEIGDLLVSEEERNGEKYKVILQVFALEYGSQIHDRIQEMRAGVNLEQNAEAKFYERDFVNYVLAKIKPLAHVSENKQVRIPKSLPTFFSKLRLISKDDLEFLPRGRDHIFVGHIRSGTKVIKDVDVMLPVEDIFAHHILIPATTGRGKSNLVKTILYHTIGSRRVGALVLDAHDEYYGRHGPGLKDHPEASDRLEYYTSENPPPGADTLAINLRAIKPENFEGILDLSEAQISAIRSYHRRYRSEWLTALMQTEPSESGDDIATKTMAVLQRKMRLALDLDIDDQRNIFSRHGVFDSGTKGEKTVDLIVRHIEDGKVVVLDTSKLSDEAELIVGNMVASELLRRYRSYKATGELQGKPVVTIVIEEAPRVIGTEVLTTKSSNIYATIAKEGRKFKVGLTAVTQLSSVIPKTILANMNTKIVMGNEMKQEREAIIASSSQDLSDDNRNIASLDKGEAIITSIFVPFAMPIKVPLFDEMAELQRPRRKEKMRLP